MTITEHAPATERERLIATSNEAAAVAWGNADDLSGDAGTSPLLRVIAAGLNGVRIAILAAAAPHEPAREQRPEIEEGYYSIELMGHRTRNGYLRCIQFAGRQLVEITEPEHPSGPPRHSGDDDPKLTPARVEFYSPTAVFSLTPSTEESVFNALTESEDIPF